MKVFNKVSEVTASAVFVLAAFSFSAPVQATCVPEPYIGSICATAGTYCPRDYVEANGGTLPISSYSSLYAVIGTSFGGNGVTTMGVPDLRGRSVVHYGSGPGLSPAFFGYGRGVESTTLTIAEMPEHSHALTGVQTQAVSVETTIPADSTGGSSNTPASGMVLGKPNMPTMKVYSNNSANTGIVGPAVNIPAMGVTGSTSSTGGGESFTNVPPQLVMRYCMAVDGLFPPRQ